MSTSPLEVDTGRNTVEDLQAEIHDLQKEVETLLADLAEAESCESREDFIANMREAYTKVREIRNTIWDLARGRLP